MPGTRVGVIGCQQGSVAAEPGGREVVVTVLGETRRLAAACADEDIDQTSVRALCAHLLERYRAGQDADTSGADDLKTCALAKAAYEAASSGRAIEPQG